MTKQLSKDNPGTTYGLHSRYNGRSELSATFFKDGKICDDSEKRLKIGEFTDDCFDGNIVTKDEAIKLLKTARQYDSDTGIIFCKVDDWDSYGNDNICDFAIKLSDKGVDLLNEIVNRMRTRKFSKMDDVRYKNDRDERRYLWRKFHKRFENDKKKAEEKGVSLKDYFAV